MQITVFGANGATGSEIVKAGVDRGYTMVCAVRRPETITPGERIKIVKADFSDPATVKEAISGSSIVVSAIGSGGLSDARKMTYLYSESTRAITAAMHECGTKRLFVLSSAGIDEEPAAPWFYNTFIRRYLMNTYLDMTRMETHLEETNLEWTSVRLTYLLGGKSKPYLVEDRGLNRGSFKIHFVDAADFIIKEVEEKKWIRKYPTLGYP